MVANALRGSYHRLLYYAATQLIAANAAQRLGVEEYTTSNHSHYTFWLYGYKFWLPLIVRYINY